MNLLEDSKKVQEALLKQVKPHRIAVAYIGSDYEEYVDVNNIEKIVLSPTMGSNPKAIGNLVSKIGWNKVYFLDNLHAKIYIGEEVALITSANLTKNGLDTDEQESLIEIGSLVNDEDDLEILNKKYDEIINKAIEHYPNEKIKRKKLDRLHNLMRRAIGKGILKDRTKNKTINFNNYESEEYGEFFINWYSEIDEIINWDIVKNYFSEESEEKINENISNSISLAEDDDIKEDSWVLVWKRKENAKADRRKFPYWFYVHKLIKDGSVEDNYPLLALELKNEYIPKEPFEIKKDSIFKNSFFNVIDSSNFSIFREEGEDEIFHLNKTFQKFDNFIVSLKKEYNKLLKETKNS